jgi:hypothetical protein
MTLPRVLLLLLCLGVSTATWAHKAKLDKYGCHKSKKEHYHCHEGILKGEQFRDQYDMLKEKHARERANTTNRR